MKGLRRTVRSFAIAGAAIGVVSCTIFGNLEIVQCETDGDCIPSKPVCIDKLCGKGTTGDAALDGGLDAPADVTPDTVVDESCKTNADCKELRVCRASKCELLVNEDCPRLPTGAARDAYRDENAVIVGIYVGNPLGGSTIELPAAERALTEIDDVLRRSANPMRIAGVFCEKRRVIDGDAAAKTSARRVIDHLSRLKVPVLMGQLEESELKEIAGSDVAVMSTLGNLSALQQPDTEDVPDSGASKLPFRFLLDEPKQLAPGFDAALTAAVARVTKIAGNVTPTPLRVRLVTNDRDEALALGQALEATGFIANAKSDVSGTYDYALLPPVPASYESGAGGEIAASNALVTTPVPHVIVAVGGDEMIDLVGRTENNWPNGEKRPVWVLGARGKQAPRALNPIVQGRPGFAQRIIGVDFDGDPTKAAKLKGATNSNATAWDALYDGLFAISLGIVRADVRRAGAKASLTGADVITGLDLVLRDENVDNALTADMPDAFISAVDAIRSTQRTIHMRGTTGPWRFTVPGKRGARQMGTGTYWCFRNLTPDVLYYQPATALAGGASLCLVP